MILWQSISSELRHSVWNKLYHCLAAAPLFTSSHLPIPLFLHLHPPNFLKYQIFYITTHLHVLTTAPLNDLMTVHLFRAPTFCVKQAIPLPGSSTSVYLFTSANPSVSPLTSTELLKQLHWLPIEWRIRFKLACLVHKILNTTSHPPYLTKLLQYHEPARSTHSSASHLLSVPRQNLSFGGARAFRVPAPKIWNSIPLHMRQSQTYSSFRRHLKTHYFISAYLAP